MGRELKVDLTWTGPERHEEIKKLKEGGPSGLYVIVAGKMIADKWNRGTFKLLDIGQASDLFLRIAEHDREDCWHAHGRGSHLLVKIAELPGGDYDEATRRSLACCLRASERPPCGTECNEGFFLDDTVVITNRGDPFPLQEGYSC